MLKSSASCARSPAFAQKREREGAIDFGDNEVKFELDENGKPLKA
jgi:exoribonuclease R